MVDDFGGYKALFADGVTELGCLAHARRKFFDLNRGAAQSDCPGGACAALRRCTPSRPGPGACTSTDAHGTAAAEGAAPAQSLHDWLQSHSPDGSQWRRHGQGHRLQPEALAGA